MSEIQSTTTGAYIDEITLPGISDNTSVITTHKLRDATLNHIHYSTCTSTGDTSTKVITCETLITPTVGDILIVTFSTTNTVTSQIYFEINSITYSVAPNEQLMLEANHPYIFYYDNGFVLKDKLIYELPAATTETADTYRLALSSTTAPWQEITIPATADAVFYNPSKKVLSINQRFKFHPSSTTDNESTVFQMTSKGLRLDYYHPIGSDTNNLLFFINSTNCKIQSDQIKLQAKSGATPQLYDAITIQSSTTNSPLVTIDKNVRLTAFPAQADTADTNEQFGLPVLVAPSVTSPTEVKYIDYNDFTTFFPISISGSYLPLSAGQSNQLTGNLYITSGYGINILTRGTKGTQYVNDSGTPANVWAYINFFSKTATGTANAEKYGCFYCGSQSNNDSRTYMAAYTNYASSNTYSAVYANFGVSINKSTSPTRRTYTNCKVYGAVWNDYAEYRTGSVTAGGFCVTETTSGQMIKSTERLQPGCRVTSDTFGFAIGESDRAQSPVAVSGRVLVYPYRPREEYTLGAALCSAPNGTVDIMTREEIREYPERIIGTVSEIPEYEIWHGGEGTGDQDVPVDGRIWIYVK